LVEGSIPSSPGLHNMKRYTHPPFYRTLITAKEGSTFHKEWFYLRPKLSLNTNGTSWEDPKSRGNLAGKSLNVPTGRAAIRLRGERLRNLRTRRLQ
jgi:hypothetical protein